MKQRRPLAVRAGPLLGLALAIMLSPASGATQRRFALLAGNDRGGPDTRPLLYASQDARRLHAVLTQLGGVSSGDAELLINRSAGDFLRALAKIEARIVEAQRRGERTMLIVYYSGHAKDGELRLGDTRVGFADLRARLVASPADIRVGIFDSCRSGLITRSKGARHAPAFEIEASGSEETRGLVLLTSASADEDAQESDEIGGSYFSQYLVSGLRGDADRSRDRRVTLSEAYAYAYARTVAETAESTAGAQHPTFSFDLKGNADLVLSDLGSRREGLYIPTPAPAGIYYLVDANGFIAAEVMKPADGDRQIALPPGKYHVRRRLADRLRIGELRVSEGQVTVLDEARLKDAPFSDDPVKGGRREPGIEVTLSLGGTMQAFFDAPTRDSLFPPTGLFAGEVQIRNFFRRGWMWGLDLAAGKASGQVTRLETPFPFRFSEFTAGTTMAAEWALFDRSLYPYVGVRLAYLLLNRTFDDPTIPAQYFSTFSPGLVVGLRYTLWSDFSVLGRGRLHYLLYNIDGNRSLGYWELTAGLAYDF
mgnify:CR=1 FL=1